MRDFLHTTRFTRRRLPHWEVEGGRYFVTIRCHDSLPSEVVARLREMSVSLQAINAASPKFAQLQRSYFSIMEKYLDRGIGEAPLRDPRAAQTLIQAFSATGTAGAMFPHYSIMPNHWHAMITAGRGQTIDLHATLAQLKGRTARAINQTLGRSGPLWQREWFDRWMRDDAEWDRCVAYIQRNPVKAGIVRDWHEHPWTR